MNCSESLSGIDWLFLKALRVHLYSLSLLLINAMMWHVNRTKSKTQGGAFYSPDNNKQSGVEYRCLKTGLPFLVNDLWTVKLKLTYISGQTVFDAVKGKQPERHCQLVLGVLLNSLMHAQQFLTKEDIWETSFAESNNKSRNMLCLQSTTRGNNWLTACS